MGVIFNISVTFFITLLVFQLVKLDECDKKWPRCNKIRNIACERSTCDPVNSSCVSLAMDNKFRQWILDEHNRLRNDIASGNETRGGAGPAANMRAVSYHEDLEYVVSCNVNRCIFGHDKCRSTRKFARAGQNLFWASGPPKLIYRSMHNWYAEIQNMDADRFDAYLTGTKGVGHFTQIVWATTSHVGCAKAAYPSKRQYFFGCNYGPAGNILTRPVYKRGAPCSECPKGLACNKKYPALCGEVEPIRISRSGKIIQIFLSWKYLIIWICLFSKLI